MSAARFVQQRLFGGTTRGREITVGIGPRYQRVRRIFSRGAWEKNGRFYGPWWQGLSSELRSQIFINDTPTVEIDFKAIHIQILAAQQGVELPADPYELPPGLFPDTDPKEQRSLVKQLVLTALNAKDEISACAAFRDGLDLGHSGKHLKNVTLKKAIEAFKERVPALADSLCSDAGIGLMFTDSQIMERVIKQCSDMGLPVLTVHDSAIVPYTHSKLLEALMLRASEEVVGHQISVEAKTLGLDTFMQDPVYVQLDFETWRETERSEGYLNRLKEWEGTTGWRSFLLDIDTREGSSGVIWKEDAALIIKNPVSSVPYSSLFPKFIRITLLEGEERQERRRPVKSANRMKKDEI